MMDLDDAQLQEIDIVHRTLFAAGYEAAVIVRLVMLLNDAAAFVQRATLHHDDAAHAEAWLADVHDIIEERRESVTAFLRDLLT